MTKLWMCGLSALALVLCFPPFSLGWLAWFALVPVMGAIRLSRSPKEAMTLAAATGLLFYAISLHWFYYIFSVLSLSLWCLLAVFMGLFGYLARRYNRSWMQVILWPVLWVGIEYFRSEIWTLKYSWFALGYSQWNQPDLLQLAGTVGVYGMSGLILLVNAIAALVWVPVAAEPGVSKRNLALRYALRPLAVAAAAALIAVLIFAGRMSYESYAAMAAGSHETEIKVACVQSESFDMDRFALLVRQASREHPQIIILPEYSVFLNPGRTREFELERLSALARESGGYLVVGVIDGTIDKPKHRTGDKFTPIKNYALVIAPDGKIAGRHQKVHLVQFIEKLFEPGKEHEPINLSCGRVGFQVCYDMDYTDGALLLARQGAGAILNPSMISATWGLWAHLQHGAMVPLRAVESRRWIARAASSGVSEFVDPQGKITAEFPVNAEGVLVGAMKISDSSSGVITAYHAWGFGIPIVCMWVTALFALYSLRWEFESLWKRSR